MDKKIIAIIRRKYLLNWPYVVCCCKHCVCRVFLVLFCDVALKLLSSFAIILLSEEERGGCFTLHVIEFLLPCGHLCSVSLPHRAMGWSVIVAFPGCTQLRYLNKAINIINIVKHFLNSIELIVKYNVGLKTLLQLCYYKPLFYGV